MVLHCSIVAASILLVLISTPADVEGTCTCSEVCPNYNGDSACWFTGVGDTKCVRYVCVNHENYGISVSDYSDFIMGERCSDFTEDKCDANCHCNTFGCNCDPCEFFVGGCGLDPYRNLFPKKELMDAKEEKDGCGDFNYFRSLSADGKRNSLAEKYCGGKDQVVREDIYKVLLHEVLKKLDGITPSEVVSYIKNAGGIDKVLTCDLFNKAYIDVSHLTLCEEKQQHPAVVPANTKKGKKQKRRRKKKKETRETFGNKRNSSRKGASPAVSCF